MPFFVRNFQWPELGVFLFRSPTQPAISKTDDADNDENNADDSGRFHVADLKGDGDP